MNEMKKNEIAPYASYIADRIIDLPKLKKSEIEGIITFGFLQMVNQFYSIQSVHLKGQITNNVRAITSGAITSKERVFLNHENAELKQKVKAANNAASRADEHYVHLKLKEFVRARLGEKELQDFYNENNLH